MTDDEFEARLAQFLDVCEQAGIPMLPWQQTALRELLRDRLVTQ